MCDDQRIVFIRGVGNICYSHTGAIWSPAPNSTLEYKKQGTMFEQNNEWKLKETRYSIFVAATKFKSNK